MSFSSTVVVAFLVFFVAAAAAFGQEMLAHAPSSPPYSNIQSSLSLFPPSVALSVTLLLLLVSEMSSAAPLQNLMHRRLMVPRTSAALLAVAFAGLLLNPNKLDNL